MNRNLLATNAIPMSLQLRRPIRELVHLVQQQNRRSPLCAHLCIRPGPLPKAGKSCVWVVTCSVDRLIAELGSKLEEQSGLANLPGTGQYLDAYRSGFT